MIAPAENRILWLPDAVDERGWDWDGGSSSASGVRITPENALSVATVFACVRVLAESVATPPLYVLELMQAGGKRRATELPLYRLLNLQPNGWQTSFEWRCQMMLHACLYQVAYCEIRRGASGAADQLVPLHPSRMKPERLENGRLRYRYREDGGKESLYNQDQILAIRGFSDDGVNPLNVIEQCKDAIALARACELHASRFFANGARPGFVLSTDSPLNAEARESIRAQWDRRHGGVNNAFSTAVLTGGLKPYDIPQLSNTDSQLAELRRQQDEQICRLFRVPPHKVQIMSSQPAGTLEQVSQEFHADTVLPWLRRFESAFMRDLIVEDDRYEIQFDTRYMMRADAAGRATYYRSLWDIGAYSTNDILAAEGMNPVEGGDVRYRPLNMGVLGEDPSVGDVLAQQQPGSGIDGQAVEGGVAAAEGVTEPMPKNISAEVAPQVADVSLNGAQIMGLIAIISQIQTGLVTKDGAAALIAAAFPSISQQQIAAILAGVTEQQQPAAVPGVETAPAPTAARSLPDLRAMTLSIDFDRTFAADPALWGEFARKAVEDGNTVVMISRREDTPENQQTVADALGDYRGAFSQVLLIGSDTLKADAAASAGIDVDVWVDDSPQTITDKPAPEPKKRSRKKKGSDGGEV